MPCPTCCRARCRGTGLARYVCDVWVGNEEEEEEDETMMGGVGN